MDNRFFVKRRPLWDIRSLQLARESVTSRCVQSALAHKFQGIQICVPISYISLGTHISCASSLSEGISIFQLLYSQSPEDLENAQRYGLVALEALRSAKIHSMHFFLFGLLYKWYRLLKLIILSKEYSLVPHAIQTKLNKMVLSSARRIEPHKILMHGDLHSGNLIADTENKRLVITDTELMGLGKAVTDFAHLWIGYHFAGDNLGKSFYLAYMDQNHIGIKDVFDSELRAEIALKCYFMVIKAKKVHNQSLEDHSFSLMRNMIDFDNFKEFLFSTHS